jgi:hypothetical protein
MWRFVLLSLGLIALAGCGSGQRELRAHVKGTISYNGQAVNGGTLVLHPKTGNFVTIGINQDGTFDSADVPEGEYVVVVQPTKGFAGPSTKGMDPAKMAEMKSKIDEMKRPPTIPIPPKYTQQTTSDLRVTVSKDSDKPIELVLKD